MLEKSQDQTDRPTDIQTDILERLAVSLDVAAVETFASYPTGPFTI